MVDKACEEHFMYSKVKVSSKTPDVVIIHSNMVKEADRSSLQSSDSSVIDETLFEQDDKRQNDEDNTANKVQEIHEESDSDDGHSPADDQTLETEQTSAATDDVATSTGGSDDDKQIIAAMKEKYALGLFTYDKMQLSEENDVDIEAEVKEFEDNVKEVTNEVNEVTEEFKELIEVVTEDEEEDLNLDESSDGADYPRSASTSSIHSVSDKVR